MDILHVETMSNTVPVLFFSIFPYIRSLQQDYLVYVVVVVVVVVVIYFRPVLGCIDADLCKQILIFSIFRYLQD